MNSLKILSFLIVLTACANGEMIELEGRIGKKALGEFTLTRNKDRISGTYRDLLNSSTIQVEGTLLGDDLRLEEYAQKDKLTGFFEGKFDDGRYVGNWLSPDRRTSVPFSFKATGGASPVGVDGSIAMAYTEWAKRKNHNSPELCTAERCSSNLAKSENGITASTNDCLISLPEEIDEVEVLTGDLNNDGVEDGILAVSYKECVALDGGGIALQNILASHQTLIIVSDEDRFTVLDELPNMTEYIDRGAIEKIEDGVIIGKGRANSGAATVPLWELDEEWEVRLRLEEGKLVLLSKSPTRNLND